MKTISAFFSTSVRYPRRLPRLGLVAAAAFCLMAIFGSFAHAAACKVLIIKPSVTLVRPSVGDDAHNGFFYNVDKDEYSDIQLHVSVTVSGGSGHYYIDFPIPQDNGWIGSESVEVRAKPGQTTARWDWTLQVHRNAIDVVNQYLTVTDAKPLFINGGASVSVYNRVPVTYKVNSKYGTFENTDAIGKEYWTTSEGNVIIQYLTGGKTFRATNEHFVVNGKVTGNGTVLDGTFTVTDRSLDLVFEGYAITAWSNPKCTDGRFIATLNSTGGWTAKWGWGAAGQLNHVLNGW